MLKFDKNEIKVAFYIFAEYQSYKICLKKIRDHVQNNQVIWWNYEKIII